VKPKLLIVELWQVGDLTIATPFIRKAAEHFDVTVLAKPFAFDLQKRFWPPVKVITFSAPWTAFNRKYRLLSWPWRDLISVLLKLRRERFDVAVTARWDPRNHFLLWLTGAKARIGFPRAGSGLFLTHPLPSPGHLEHHYEYWRSIALSLHLDVEPRDKIKFPPRPDSDVILIHTGARHPVRIWPLENYGEIVKKLRARGHKVRVACNPEQVAWWKNAGENDVIVPTTIHELLDLLSGSGLFIGNDSGPGHLAAFCGVPTFTFFGPQVSEWFVPLHPDAELMDGKACPYKPCSDYCCFPVPHCLYNITEAETWPKLVRFVDRHLRRVQSQPVQPALT
jgi:ADP-heptose:LPS heptosyltransferase